jgi:hypothetical protein
MRGDSQALGQGCGRLFELLTAIGAGGGNEWVGRRMVRNERGKGKNCTECECVREFMNGSWNEFRQRDSVSPDGY